MRPPPITGDECPGGNSRRQMRFLPVPNSAGSPALSETPVPFGPRNRSHCPHAAPPSSTTQAHDSHASSSHKCIRRALGKKRLSPAAPLGVAFPFVPPPLRRAARSTVELSTSNPKPTSGPHSSSSCRWILPEESGSPQKTAPDPCATSGPRGLSPGSCAGRLWDHPATFATPMRYPIPPYAVRCVPPPSAFTPMNGGLPASEIFVYSKKTALILMPLLK